MVTRRAAEIKRHESAIRDLLADFFQFQSRADAVRAEAEAAVTGLQRDVDTRIAQVQERAGEAAAGFERRAREAVGRCLAAAQLRVGCGMSTHYQVRLAGVSGGDSYFR